MKCCADAKPIEGKLYYYCPTCGSKINRVTKELNLSMYNTAGYFGDLLDKKTPNLNTVFTKSRLDRDQSGLAVNKLVKLCCTGTIDNDYATIAFKSYRSACVQEHNSKELRRTECVFSYRTAYNDKYGGYDKSVKLTYAQIYEELTETLELRILNNITACYCDILTEAEYNMCIEKLSTLESLIKNFS